MQSAYELLDPDSAAQDHSHARDHVEDSEALPLKTLERWIDEIRNQPSWRLHADKCCEYYDGNQLSAERIQALKEVGLDPHYTNLIKPTVDAVLGLEAKTRTDWIVKADDERSLGVAEAFSAKLKEAERESRADRARSDAYAGQIKAGFAAVEVSRSTNPFDYPYRVSTIHRRELWWDWKSTKPDWSDARWLVRKRWHDADLVAAHFPQHAELIRHAASGWSNYSDWMALLDKDQSSAALYGGARDVERQSTIEELEWRDTERGRVCVYEAWYRTWHRGAVLVLPTGRKIEFDRRNPQHIAVVASGLVQPRVGVYDKMRVAYYIGPHRVHDQATNRRRFPYIPFWGHKEDLTGIPYGLIRAMLSPQDRVNSRQNRMDWLLKAKRVMIDADALDTKTNSFSDVSREIANANGFIVRNPNRRNPNAIEVDENFAMTQQQFQLLMEDKAQVQQTGGVYAAMMGQSSNASSGLAIQSLIEQGTTTLAEINDNYSFATRLVGEALLDLIREDMGSAEQSVQIDTGTKRKTIYLNRPAFDEELQQSFKENDVQSAHIKVVLDEVPSTPTYRAQQLAQLTEVAKSLPPNMQAFVVPFLIEATDLQKRNQIAALLRQQMGIVDPDDNSPEAMQAKEQAEAAMKQQQDINNAAVQLESRLKNAEAALKEAQAQKVQAEAQQIQNQGAQQAAPSDAQTPQLAQEVDELIQSLNAEIAQMREEMKKISDDADRKVNEARIRADADIERAEIEREKEEARADADIEIAEINARAQEGNRELQARLAQLEQELQKATQAKPESTKMTRESESNQRTSNTEQKQEPVQMAEQIQALTQAMRDLSKELKDHADRSAKDLVEAVVSAVRVKRSFKFERGPDGRIVGGESTPENQE